MTGKQTPESEEGLGGPVDLTDAVLTGLRQRERSGARDDYSGFPGNASVSAAVFEALSPAEQRGAVLFGLASELEQTEGMISDMESSTLTDARELFIGFADRLYGKLEFLATDSRTNHTAISDGDRTILITKTGEQEPRAVSVAITGPHGDTSFNLPDPELLRGSNGSGAWSKSSAPIGTRRLLTDDGSEQGKMMYRWSQTDPVEIASFARLIQDSAEQIVESNSPETIDITDE